ncbi:MAG: T9SS type A sorting domain-containing protein [Bacteroidetes bacterium]|nr:T9SS type A sorting domain-containing protein [Bacteroidota bacterium]MCL2303454.1 T9SS type A sorting domain-containing protein [Lentimicrobiaceae bacterium]
METPSANERFGTMADNALLLQNGLINFILTRTAGDRIKTADNNMINKFIFSVKRLNTFFVLLAFLGLSICGTQAQTQDEGVNINGIKWATRNLDAHGRFVEKPEDHGALFQWGRTGDGHEQRTSINYPTNTSTGNGVVSGSENFDEYGQIVNTHEAYGKFIKQSDAPQDWRSPQNDALWNSGSESVPAKTANDPCPAGWRLPTKTELASLSGGVWTNTPVAGFSFGSGNNSLFLPAAGYRGSVDGNIYHNSTYCMYWSSTPIGTEASYLYISSSFGVNMLTGNRSTSRSVRCVSDDAVGINEIENGKIIIYPNPTTGNLRIESGKLKIDNIDIFDVYGRKLLSTLSLRSQYTTIDISHLPAGVYIVKLYTESGEMIKKVLKE